MTLPCSPLVRVGGPFTFAQYLILLLLSLQADTLEINKPLAAERKTSMPTTSSRKSLETSDKLSPASQLAQLEREQKLRQEEQNKLLRSDIIGIDNSENEEGDNSKNDSSIRVRLFLYWHEICFLFKYI